MDKTIILLSGGLDSLITAIWAKQNFSHVEYLSFDYHQKHILELQSAEKIVSALHLDGQVITLPDIMHPVPQFFPNQSTNFFPLRNLIMLSCAISVAVQKGIQSVSIGVNAEDFMLFPDCRESFFIHLEQTVYSALEKHIHIYRPFIRLEKWEMIKYADREFKDLFRTLLPMTITCYNGLTPPCGECDSCKVRIGAFKKAGIIDPITQYV